MCVYVLLLKTWCKIKFQVKKKENLLVRAFSGVCVLKPAFARDRVGTVTVWIHEKETSQIPQALLWFCCQTRFSKNRRFLEPCREEPVSLSWRCFALHPWGLFSFKIWSTEEASGWEAKSFCLHIIKVSQPFRKACRTCFGFCFLAKLSGRSTVVPQLLDKYSLSQTNQVGFLMFVSTVVSTLFLEPQGKFG